MASRKKSSLFAAIIFGGFCVFAAFASIDPLPGTRNALVATGPGFQASNPPTQNTSTEEPLPPVIEALYAAKNDGKGHVTPGATNGVITTVTPYLKLADTPANGSVQILIECDCPSGLSVWVSYREARGIGSSGKRPSCQDAGSVERFLNHLSGTEAET